MVLAVAIQLTPLAAPLLLSSDAWTYWMYGRIAAVHGESPYDQPPEAFPDDPALPWTGPAWRDQTSLYGPAFTLASEPVALASGESEDAAAWLFKAIAAAAMLTAALLAARLAVRKELALALAGWNPVLALHAAGGGHNDAWLGALVLAALALAASERRRLAERRLGARGAREVGSARLPRAPGARGAQQRPARVARRVRRGVRSRGRRRHGSSGA